MSMRNKIQKLVIIEILIILGISMMYPAVYAVEENIVKKEVQENQTQEQAVENEIQENTAIENNIISEITKEVEEENETRAENQISNFEQETDTLEIIEKPIVNANETSLNYTGEICIDTPANGSSYNLPDTTKINLSGWAVSTDTESVIKLYVNEVYWGEIPRTFERPDVNAVKPNYASTTKLAGYTCEMDIRNFPEGQHKIKVEQVSRYGQVISVANTMILVKQKSYQGEMYIDSPSYNSNYHLPDTTKINLSGWAVSSDTESVIKLYVNEVYWGEIPRTFERPDVNAVKPNYASTTKLAGYTCDMDIGNFPEGQHSIKVEQVSRYGQVISSSNTRIQVKTKKYTGELWIDEPRNNPTCKVPNINQIKLSGWAVSTDTESVIKLYVNEVYWGEIPRTFERPDVNVAKPNYASTTKLAGYTCNMDIGNFPEGQHSIKVEQVSRYGQVLNSVVETIYVSTPDYAGEMFVDMPIQNKRYTSGVLVISGWAVNNSPDDYVLIYLDGVCQTGAEKKQRNDVVHLYKEKYGLTDGAKPGFYSEIGTAQLKEGIHTLKIVNYSKYNKKIQEQEIKFIISNTQTWGIDVSHHNETINWDAVKQSGINFAILKIGEYRESSGRTIVDSKFEENYAACKARGIAVGGYFYSYAFNPMEAAHEADACTRIIAGKTFEMPIFFDIEDHIVTDAVKAGRTNREHLTNAVITFCDVMNLRGYKSGVYSYRNFLYEYLDMSRVEKYNVWLAHYVENTDYTGRYDIWQYTSSGRIPGINGNGGNVDLNWCYKRYY